MTLSNGHISIEKVRAALPEAETVKSEVSTRKRKYTKNQWITMVTLAFGNFCVGTCLSLQAPFFPQEAERKGATPTEFGLIFGAFQLTIFFAAPLMGKLISYVEPKFMLNAGIFTTGVTCILFGFLAYVNGSDTFVNLAFAIRITEGMGAAALRTSCYAIIAAQFPDNMTTIFASLETFFGIGLITGPTLGGVLYDQGGFGLPFFVVGSFLLVDAFIICIVLPKPGHPKNKQKGKLLKFWFHPSAIIYGFTIFSSFNYIGFNQATLEPHVRSFNLPAVYLGLLFGISGACYALSAPFWGWLCDKKLNVQYITIFGCLLNIISILLIGPLPFLHLKKEISLTITALLFMGLATAAKIIPTFTAAMQDTVARGFSDDINTYALVSSMIASSQSLGAFVGPSIGGYLLEKKGYDFSLSVVLTIEVVLLVFLIVYTLVCKRLFFKSSHSPEEKPILVTTHNSYS